MRDFLNFSSDKLPKRAFRARLPQLFKRQASKTSISCEASSTFEATKLPKRAFRARFLQLFKQGASKAVRLPRKTRKWPLTLKVWSAKTSISCETSFKFHTFNFKIDDFVRVFLISHVYRAQKVWLLRSFRHFSRHSRNAAPATIFERVSRLRVPASAIRGNSTFATSQNAAPATTSRKATSQSAAPATKKRRACIDSLPKYCACHAKHENDLTFCDLGAPKRAFRARLPPLFILWRNGLCRSACVPPNREKLTTTRRRHDDEATTRRRRGDDDTTTTRRTRSEHRSNPRPQL